MTYEKIVEKLRKAYAQADATPVGGHKAIQLNVRGEGEGALYVEAADGKFNVQPYEYYDNDAVVTIPSKVLLDIMDGKAEPADAYREFKFSVIGDENAAIIVLSLRKVSEAKKTVKKAEKAATEAAKKAETVVKETAEKVEKAAKKAAKTAKPAAEKAVKAAKKAAETAKPVADKAVKATEKTVKETAKKATKAAKTAKKATKAAVDAAKETVKEAKAEN